MRIVMTMADNTKRTGIARLHESRLDHKPITDNRRLVLEALQKQIGESPVFRRGLKLHINAGRPTRFWRRGSSTRVHSGELPLRRVEVANGISLDTPHKLTSARNIRNAMRHSKRPVVVAKLDGV